MSRPLVVLGVTGGIAAYKSADLIRRLKDQDLDVQVIATNSALKFVGETTFAALSGKPVISDIWDKAHEVEHVQIAKSADAIVVAPATADFLAHLVYGFANDALLATLLVAKCPIILAPAMHTEMWENSATRENVATLRKRGFLVLEPAVGKLTGEDQGVGRLPDTNEIARVVKQVVNRKTTNLPKDLSGLNVLISAGGTREAIDPIRFIGNRASGKQGVALALSALSRGAKVTLVGANLNVEVPAGVEFVAANTALEMMEQMQLRAGSADIVIMNAAVADYFVPNPEQSKIKKDSDKLSIELSKTGDILTVLSDNKPVKQYLYNLARLRYDNVTISWHNAEYVSNFTKQPDGTYTALVAVEQEFTGIKSGEANYTYHDVTQKHIEVTVKMRDEKNINGVITKSYVEVFLGNIGVTEE
jgi:phosphopantothenoylcysteine decarboxylase/phosphopantothenate--cysteine ligase